ncbi:MAG: hypothetical protein AAF602_23470, partial [Myxococcota bacterium]
MHRIVTLIALSWPGLAFADPSPLPDDAARLVPKEWSAPTLEGGTPWYTGLGEGELSILLDAALVDNVDAQAAELRVDRARATNQQTASALLP